uniref:Uncharacterized protein n=1 Tax=Amphilophus citrinellus TaxID=61819 RepID=A0A3Q0RQI7_AMPCI
TTVTVYVVIICSIIYIHRLLKLKFLSVPLTFPLHNACSYGHYEVAELLVRHGASVNVADLWKFTPLHEAAAKGKYEICKLLLKVWFFPNTMLILHYPAGSSHKCAKKKYPPTPLHRYHSALLIKYNTCVNATDKWAFTPLHEAAQKGRTQLCALLLAHGADPTMKNQEGQTPLDLATHPLYITYKGGVSHVIALLRKIVLECCLL